MKYPFHPSTEDIPTAYNRQLRELRKKHSTLSAAQMGRHVYNLARHTPIKNTRQKPYHSPNSMRNRTAANAAAMLPEQRMDIRQSLKECQKPEHIDPMNYIRRCASLGELDARLLHDKDLVHGNDAFTDTQHTILGALATHKNIVTALHAIGMGRARFEKESNLIAQKTYTHDLGINAAIFARTLDDPKELYSHGNTDELSVASERLRTATDDERRALALRAIGDVTMPYISEKGASQGPMIRHIIKGTRKKTGIYLGEHQISALYTAHNS